MSQSSKPISPFVVAIASLLVPGLGYGLIKEKTRGLAIGISILALFVLGILIGGIRIVDPPGYGEFGYHVMLVRVPQNDHSYIVARVDPTSQDNEDDPTAAYRGSHAIGWALTAQPLAELGEKPWYVGQILCGPVAVVMSAVAVHAAEPVNSFSTPVVSKVPPSHSRSWEIGTLYTAVAGMLNLLAVIDSAWRASQTEQN